MTVNEWEYLMSTTSLKSLNRHPLIYLATPYSSYKFGLHAAFVDAAKAAATLIKHSVHCYCPIAHTHPIAEYGAIDKLDHTIWLDLDSKMLALCDALVVVNMEGWEISKGVRFEVDYFLRHHKPIYLGHWLHLERSSPYVRLLDNDTVGNWLDLMDREEEYNEGLERNRERENTATVT